MEDRRESKRFDVSQASTMLVDGKVIDVQIKDVSFGGILLDCEARFAVGTRVVLRDPRFGEVGGEIIRQFDGGLAVMLEKTDGSAAYALKSITLNMIGGD